METFSPFLRWILAFVAVLLAVTSPAVGQTSETRSISAPTLAADAQAPELFQRIVILGASVSDGFTSTEPFGGPRSVLYRFENFIEAAIAKPHKPVKTHAQRFLFLKPVETMQKQVGATLAEEPSLVVALDALFWFCYGNGLSSEARLKRFETGLELIGEIGSPIVIGDIPDASQAVGKILNKASMPELSTIAQCNERLKAWAASRKNVTIFPLSEIMRKASADADLEISGISWAAGTSRSLLQSDSLHPSRHGLAGLAIAALKEAAQAANLSLEDAGVLSDPEAVYQAGLALGEARIAEQRAEAPAGVPKK